VRTDQVVVRGILSALESPFREPASRPVEPEKAPSAPPIYRYVQPTRRGPAIGYGVFATFLAVVVAKTHDLGGVLFLLPLAFFFAWAGWHKLRTRFAIQLEPVSGRVTVRALSQKPGAGWPVMGEVALGDILDLHLRRRGGRFCRVVLAVRTAGGRLEHREYADWVISPPLLEKEAALELQRIAHFLENARAVHAKLAAKAPGAASFSARG
jgi:hypothetical protein